MVAFPARRHVSRGIDRANETLDVAPFLNVADSIDPVNFYYEEALRNGILTINVQQGVQTVVAGQGMVVKPYGMTVESMMIKPRAGLTMSAAPKRGKTRATQAQALRGAFEDLERYLREMVQQEEGRQRLRSPRGAVSRPRDRGDAKGRPLQSSAWKIDGFELVPRGEVDEKRAPLLAVIEGRMRLHLVRHSLDVHRPGRRGGQRLHGQHHPRPHALLEGRRQDQGGRRLGPPRPNLVRTQRDPLTGEEIETFVRCSSTRACPSR